MVRLSIFLCFTLLYIPKLVIAQKNLQVAFVDPLQKIFPETTFFGKVDPVAHVAKGEYATFQLAIRSAYELMGLKLNILIPDFDNDQNENIEVGYVDYVKVGRSYPNPAIDQLKSLSSFYPDPIINDKPINLKPEETRSIWITVPISKDVNAGHYKLKLNIEAEGDVITKTMDIIVYDVVLETSGLWITNWFSTTPERLRQMNNDEEIVAYSETYWKLIRVLARKMSDYGQNMALISPLDLTIFSEVNGQLKMDFSRFDKMVSIFQEEGVLGRIEGGHIGSRESTWESHFQVRIPRFEDNQVFFEKVFIERPEAEQFYKQFFVELYDHLEKKGWKDKYFQHIADEPINSNVQSYVKITQFIKSIIPEMKVIEACHTKDLQNMIDIWVPQLDFLHQDFDFYQQRQTEGDEVWYYTCLGPKGNYANRFLDLPLIKTRLLHWINFKYGITGYLHWGLNVWNENPFEESTSINKESGNVLPGGDSWIVYPSYHNLYSSIRFEAMRDGINDYALLVMLNKKNSSLVKELVNEMIYRFDWYDTNTHHFWEMRKRILNELSRSL